MRLINSARLLLSVLCLLSVCLHSSAKDTIKNEKSKQLFFIENAGQIKNQFGQKRKDILFELTTANIDIFVSANSIHYQWNKRINDTTISACRLDAILIGANKFAEIITEDSQAYYENYYFEDGSINTTAHTFKTVRIKNIYPKIDWVLYVKNNMLKYDFVVHTGGDVNNIKIKYEGAEKVGLINGEITVETPYGKIQEQLPYTYDAINKKEIQSRFTLNGNIVGFDIDEKKDGMVIDPAVLWATYYGGNNTDYGNCVATDNDGNAYLGGSTYSSTGIATTGAYITTYPSTDPGYIVKFNAAGARLWGTYFVFTGSTATTISKITIDNNGTIYGCGVAVSGSLGNIGIFSFTSTGSYKWQSVYGASTVDEEPADISYFGGKIYVVGNVKAASNFITTGSHQTTYGTNTDGFILKRDTNASGSINWATYYGGSGTEYALGCTFDKAGYLYVAGHTTSSTSIATTGTHQSAWGSGPDAFLVKFDTSGSRIWGTYYGGSSADYGHEVAVDSSNNVYICGLTISNSAIATTGAYRTSPGAGYIVKFNSNGIRQWGTYVESALYSIIIGKDDILYCAGKTTSSTGIATSGAFNSSFSGGTGFDAFVHAYNLSGNNLIWGSYFGGFNDDYVTDLVYHNATLFMSGNTQSSAGIATTGAFRTSINLNIPDAFLANIIIDTVVAVQSSLVSTCSGLDITVPYTTNASFLSGNTFTVQLSNASGSFSSPINIGTVSATNAGNITCNIPSSTIPGSGYRIRVVSTNPARISSDNGQNITINATPAKPIATSNTPVCTGNTLNLSASTSTSGVSYSWIGPASYSSSLQSPSINGVVTTQAGNYIVTVTANGCSTKDTETVVVNTTPIKPIATSNTPVCTGDTLNLSASTGTSGVSYSWTGPASYSSSLQSPSISGVVTTQAGDYIVTVTANGCSAKDTETVVVNVTPTKPIATSNTPVCTGDTLNLSASTSTGSVSYNWIGPSSYSSSLQSPIISSISSLQAGDYIVTVTANGCSAKDTETVIVNTTPAKPVATSNTPVCIGDTLNLSASTGTSGVSYSWIGPSSYSSSLQSPGISGVGASQSGDYVVTVTTNGCSAKDTETVVVNTTPTAKPTATSNTPVCTGDTLNLSASTGTSGVSYSWAGPTSYSSSLQSPSISSVSSSQTGDYIVTVTLNGCSAKDTETVVIKPSVIANVTMSVSPSVNVGPWATIKFTALATQVGVNAKYQWKKNGVNIPGATLPIYTGTTNVDFYTSDTICVFVTTDTTCAPAIVYSCADAIKINLGISNNSISDAVIIYPNPFDDVLTIKGITKVSSLSMYDMLGRQVLNSITPANPYIINTANMKAGMYFLVLTNEDGDRYEYKLVKHK